MRPMNHTPAVAGVWFYIRLSPEPLPTKPRAAEQERTAKRTPLRKATARQAWPAKDPAPNENEQPNEPPSAKQQPAEHGPRKTPRQTRPPQITKTKPNEDTKRPGAKNPHEPHPLRRGSLFKVPIAHTNPPPPRLESCERRPVNDLVPNKTPAHDENQ
ncbi:hypothetical protein BS47DRAFT_1369588 [Hydnum rufescens UP504]|uniref:Uncharacterized protein n=1 Tax=Hydnum rufescens UP504 TaxID=1448309 RepID=A0A9P6DLS7_9AGAM|nr:hypothetical protein BS47DRAFT_1369588 [Hydnum rufescens UP504]